MWNFDDLVYPYFGSIATESEIKIAKHFYQAGLLHAAEQDEERAKEFNDGKVNGFYHNSASMHRQAASEVK